MPAVVNITCENDADFIRGFIYATDTGTPIDLTGSTFRMGIRRRAEDVIEELLLTTENGGLIITNAVNGNFTLHISQQQLLELPVGDYEHSLVQLVGGTKNLIWTGALTNNAGPSR